MKKILVVFTTAFVRTGGLASVMLNYWRHMDKTGLSFDFASTNIIDNSLLKELEKEGSKYFQLPKRKSVIPYFNHLRKLCKGYDIIHVHANSATSIIELFAAKLSKIPRRIHHNHTSRSKYPKLNKLLHPLLKYACTDAVACSKEAGEWLFGHEKYVVMPNAIDIDRYKYNPIIRKTIREEFGIIKDEFVVGHVGKFMDAKNHYFLIKTFAKFHSKHPNSKLLLVGDGCLRNNIEKWVEESGCIDSIILAGLRSDIASLLQAFDTFVFPSVYEGLPLSVLEAQSAGLPCLISSKVTSDVNIGDSVIMKDLEDGIESWAEAIGNIDYKVSREERCKINYHLLTESHFNIKREVSQLQILYSK